MPKIGHTQTKVLRLPNCDFCKDGTKAKYDARIPRMGGWANVCESHFQLECCSLGLGLGQELILEKSEEK